MTAPYTVDNPYLEAHPPARVQSSLRHLPESGTVMFHTAEGVMDDVGPDTGAENVAGFIAGRSDPGNYPCIVDSDSAVIMIPDALAAFHVAASDYWGINLRHGTWAVGFATSAHLWGTNPRWDERAIAIAGRETAKYLLRVQGREPGFDPRSSLRWLTPDQADRREPGFCHHGTVQADRTDAWLNHPLREQLEADLIAAVELHLPSDPNEDWLSMATEDELREIIQEELGGVNARLIETQAWLRYHLAGEDTDLSALGLEDPSEASGDWILRGKVQGIANYTRPDES